MHRRGFSLVELLVVIAIILLLVSLLMPVIGNARQRAKWSVCISNLRSMGFAIHAYANDHRGAVPYMWPTWTAMEPLKMDWKPIGMGLLIDCGYVIQGDILMFRAPGLRKSSLIPGSWLTAKHVCGDYQYWQHRFPAMFNRKAHETVLINLEKSLIMTDQVGCQDWEGFNFRANHRDGIHFLGGNVTVDFLRWNLGDGIPCTVHSWPELKTVVNLMEDKLEYN